MYVRQTRVAAAFVAALALIGTLFVPAAMADGHQLTTADLGPTQTGDLDGTGTVDLTFNETTGEVCFTIDTTDVETLTAAHIHEGAAGATGSVVVNFDIGTAGALRLSNG